MTTAKGGVIDNPRYDGTTPREAQAYLAKLWARIRAALKRKGASIYGFRIAEPNHDGTPHWHLLVFHEAGMEADIKSTVWRYALEDSGNERGASIHRVDFKSIDWSRGTAAGYIAKYVAKNIDGYKLDKDLYGNDALETSARVEAWASTWGIRQFQQVGGPPVGPWRELRRVEEVAEDNPDFLKAAHRAVNKLAVIEGRENASVAWDHYCQAQGGVFAGRSYRIRISYGESKGLGKYGEPLAPQPIGLEAKTVETYTPAHMAWMGGKAERVVHWFVKSVRHAWEIVSKKAAQARGFFVQAAQPLAPWTRVNNCTGGADDRDRNSAGTDPQSRGRGHGDLGQGTGTHQSDVWGLRWAGFDGAAAHQF